MLIVSGVAGEPQYADAFFKQATTMIDALTSRFGIPASDIVYLAENPAKDAARIKAASTKPFGFMPFYPGPGLGGHCIPIDPFYLSWKARELGRPTRFIELAGSINTAMPDWVVSRTMFALNEAGKPVRGARILVVGLAYKQDVDDTRESPSFELIEKFRELQTQTSSVRTEALALAATVTGAPSRDVNYIIPRFVLHELPLGLAGLFIAGVMAAAMSSIAAELNSLSTATVIDFYRRWFRPEATEAHYLRVSKVATRPFFCPLCASIGFAVSTFANATTLPARLLARSIENA